MDVASAGPVEEVLDAAGIAAALERLAGDLARDLGGAPDLCFIGIKRRGDVLAKRLNDLLAARPSARGPFPLGSLDITLYRDDFDALSEELAVGQSDIPFALDGATVVLVDDVLFTGRTARAALDLLLDLGRPARIVLVVLIDRGGRELPIAADYVGHRLSTAPGDVVQVLLQESDGRDAVTVQPAG